MILNESPKDAIGRPLVEGDGVIVMLPGSIVFRIVRMEHTLDPRQPPGLLIVHLVAAMALTTKSGAKHGELLRIGTLAELGPLPFEMNALPPKDVV